MNELQCAGSWFSHHNTKLSVKDHSILEALSASLDDQEDTHVGPASSAYEAKHEAPLQRCLRRQSETDCENNRYTHPSTHGARIGRVDGRQHDLDWHSRFQQRSPESRSRPLARRVGN